MTDRYVYEVARDDDQELGVFAARVVSEDAKYWRLDLDDLETTKAFGLASRRSKDRKTYFSPREALWGYLVERDNMVAAAQAGWLRVYTLAQLDQDIADAEELLKEFPE